MLTLGLLRDKLPPGLPDNTPVVLLTQPADGAHGSLLKAIQPQDIQFNPTECRVEIRL